MKSNDILKMLTEYGKRIIAGLEYSLYPKKVKVPVLLDRMMAKDGFLLGPSSGMPKGLAIESQLETRIWCSGPPVSSE